MATALSGPNSRRRLGTQSGDMRREARKLERGGYGKAGEAMALAASEQRMTEGSAISNSANREAFERKQQALDRGLMETKRRATTGAEAPAAPSAPSAGAAASTAGLTRPGSSRSMLAPPSSSAEQAADDAFGTPFATPAAPREGRINGMPASQAIAAVGKPAQFGKEFATQNLDKLGLTGAIADYRRREAEAGKPAEPGNMAEMRERDSPTSKPTPLNDAMTSATAGRTLSAPAAAPNRLTAQMTAAPAPRLDVGGLRRPATAPAATLAATPDAAVPVVAGPPTPVAPGLRTRLNVSFGPYKNKDTTFLSARDKARAKKAAEDAKNKELSGRKSTRPGLLTRMGLRKPAFLEDSLAGDLYDATNK